MKCLRCLTFFEAQDVNAGLLYYIRSSADKKTQRPIRTSSDMAIRPSNEHTFPLRTAVSEFSLLRTSSHNFSTTTNNGVKNTTSTTTTSTTTAPAPPVQDPGFYGTMRGIEARPNEIRGILIARNIMANYLYEYSISPEQAELPPVIRNPFTCKHCFTKDSCMLYHKVSLALYVTMLLFLIFVPPGL